MLKTEKKTALIGCGRIGFMLEDDPLRAKPCTHFGGALSAGVKVTHACDINNERLKKISERSGLPDTSLYTDYKKLLADALPDTVIIATWTGSHAEIAEAAINSGVKTIVIEKPVASCADEAKRLALLASEKGASVIVNHERRFDSRYRKVKELIEKGVIGRVKSAKASILTGGYRGSSSTSEGGGPLLHDGTHMVDLIRFFFGEINSVSGRFFREGRDSGFEDHAAAMINAGDGVIVFLEAGGSRKYFQFEIEISGTDGKIIIGNGTAALFKAVKSRFYRGFNDLIETDFPVIKKNNCFTELYMYVKKTASGIVLPPVSTAEDGFRSVEAIDAIYMSSYKNGKEIALPSGFSMKDVKKIFGLKKSCQ